MRWTSPGRGCTARRDLGYSWHSGRGPAPTGCRTRSGRGQGRVEPPVVLAVAQFRVHPHQRRHVARHVDLGDHGDETVRGVSDQGPQILGGVEGGVGLCAPGPAGGTGGRSTMGLWGGQIGGWAGEVDRAVDRASAAQGRPAGGAVPQARGRRAHGYQTAQPPGPHGIVDHAVELARTVRQAGFTGLRPRDLLPERSRPARSEHILAKKITGVGDESGYAWLRLPQRARVRWRRR